MLWGSNQYEPKRWRLGLVRKGGGSEGRPAARARTARDSPRNPVKFAGSPADAEGVRLMRFDPPVVPAPLRAIPFLLAAAAGLLGGCETMQAPPAPPPP